MMKMEDNLRLCNCCGEFLNISEFSPSGRGKYKRKCKRCTNLKRKDGQFSHLDSFEVQLYERIFKETGKPAFDVNKVNHEVNQVCLKCGLVKEYSEFRERQGRHDKSKNYYSHHCKSCEAYYTSGWRKRNPERAEEYSKYYRSSGKARDNYVNLAHRNLRNHLLKRARNNAKRSNVDFNLEIDDIIIPDKCPYLEIPMTNNVGLNNRGLKDSYSIDRIDPSKGYVKGNIQIISKLANTMKNEATIEELLTFSRNAIKIHSKDHGDYIV